MTQNNLTTGEIVTIFSVPHWAVRQVVDAIDAAVPRIAEYRIVPRSMLGANRNGINAARQAVDSIGGVNAVISSADDRLERIERLLALLVEQGSQPAQQWLSISDAAVYCGMSEKSVRALISDRTFESRRILRGKITLDKYQIDAAMAGAMRNPRASQGIRKTNRK